MIVYFLQYFINYSDICRKADFRQLKNSHTKVCDTKRLTNNKKCNIVYAVLNLITERNMWHTILHALIDSVKILPILFLAYVLIEFIEVKTSKTLEKSKLLKGNLAPLVGASAGLIPQCGFSVIATDLYTKRRISVGVLLAMYIATSDEAIPILLSHPNQYLNILIILAVKFLLALIVGYGCNLFFKYVYRPKPQFIGFKKDVNIMSSTISTENKSCNIITLWER